MKSAREHLQIYPHARPRTLALIEVRKAKTEQLQREINEEKIRRAVGALYPLRRAVRKFFGLEGA